MILFALYVEHDQDSHLMSVSLVTLTKNELVVITLATFDNDQVDYIQHYTIFEDAVIIIGLKQKESWYITRTIQQKVPFQHVLYDPKNATILVIEELFPSELVLKIQDCNLKT